MGEIVLGKVFAVQVKIGKREWLCRFTSASSVESLLGALRTLVRELGSYYNHPKELAPAFDWDELPTEITDKELATVLAALRTFQGRQHEYAYLDQFTENLPLNDEEIDELCIKLTSGGAL